MGTNKANLLLNGQTLLNHSYRELGSALGEFGVPEVLVSGQYPGYPCISDTLEGLGPLGGVLSTLEKLQDAYVLFVPVDMPGVSSQLLSRLIQVAIQSSDTRVCHFDGYELPIIIRSDRSLRECLRNFLLDPNRPPSQKSIRAFKSCLSERVLGLSHFEREQFSNLNTRDEWEAWVRLRAAD